MGRHAGLGDFDTAVPAPQRSGGAWSPDNPVTDPRLFDAPMPASRPEAVQAAAPAPAPVPPRSSIALADRPGASQPSIRSFKAPGPAPRPQAIRPSASPAPLAATGLVADHQRRIAPRPVAPQVPAVPRISTPYDRMPRFTDGPISIAPRLVAASLTTAPVPIVPMPTPTDASGQRMPASLAKRSAALAVCAVAVLGAVSTAAMLLPTTRNAAEAEGFRHADSSRPMPVPTTGPTFALSRHLHHHHHHHRAGRLRIRHTGAPTTGPTALARAAVPAGRPAASGATTPTASTSPSATPTTSSTPIPSSSASPTPRPAPAGGGSLLQALATGGSSVVLGSGTYSFDDFSGSNVGAQLPNGFSGQGEDRTVLEMTPHSSSKGGLVPTASGTTNPLMMLQASGGSPLLRDFTLQGTNQGHLYNGLRVRNTTNARIENVRVRAIPGDDKVNPGETFGISDFRSTGSSYSGVEIDGAGVGASGLGLNNSTGTTVSDSYFHDNPYSAGIAAWQSSNLTLTDVITKNNRTGLNFERVSGTVKVVRPTIEGNSAQDIYVGSDQSSAKITIIDPVFSGKLRIRVPSNYWAGPEQQKRSDIRVIINGVDRTSDVVQWL